MMTTNNNTTTTTVLLQHNFHDDGYIILPSLLSPSFISQLHTECLDIFTSVLNWLTLVGAADFQESCRPCRRRLCDYPNAAFDSNNSSSGSSSETEEYEYPIKLGIKNGYQELVMRSPGRYELALLIMEENNSKEEAAAMLTNNNSITEDEDCYKDKRLMSVEMIEQRAGQQFLAKHNNNNGDKNESESTGEAFSSRRQRQGGKRRSSGCLRQLLIWIKQYEHKKRSSINDDGQHGDDDHELYHSAAQYNSDTQGQEHNSSDEMNIKSFMELVSAILPRPPPSTTIASESNNNSKQTTDDDDDTTTNSKKDTTNNHHSNDEDYYLCNLSLLISTPGSPTQSWHSDGGHTSLTTHLPCHVFNVFIPLVDVPLSMGPTELRPGSHVYTRDLAKMMLLAKAKKMLRETVVSEMKRGDALVFDYRILHRGRANLSDRVVVVNDDCEDENDDVNDVDDGEEHDVVTVSSQRDNNKGRGRDRPVLVLTFARRWFVDVCNFPKRSIFSLHEE